MYKIYKYLIFTFLCSIYTANAQEIIDTDSITAVPKSEQTWAASRVGSETLLRSSAIKPNNALFGRLNGLTALQRAGYDGQGEADAQLYIRGLGSAGDNTVMVIIDGLERPLNTLILEEIEEITVYKDAVALALYGMRGANGVLSVKTKRGKQGKSDINVSYQHTWTTPTQLPEFANAYNYANAVNEGLANEGLAPRYNQQEVEAYKTHKYPFWFPDVNWINETLRNWGRRDQMNFSASGGNDRVRYFSLVNFIFDRGLIKEANLNDEYSTQLSASIMNVRTNLDIDLSSSTSMQVNLLGRLNEMNRPGSVTDGALMSNLYSLPSNAYPMKSINGEWGGGTSIYPLNPVAQTSSTGYASSHIRTLYADMMLKQDAGAWIEGLSAELRIGFDAMSEYWDSRTKQYLYEANTGRLNDAGTPIDTFTTQYGKLENELGFTTSLGSARRNTNLQFRLNYLRDNLTAFLMFKQDARVELGQFNSYMHQDFIAFGHYSVADKYFIDLSMSLSGTSRLPKGKRWGFFPALGLAYDVKKDLQSTDWLNAFKLRLSYGLTGNDRITYNLDTYPFVGGGSFVFKDAFTSLGGMAEGHLPGDVTYEKSLKLNLGIETSILNIVNFNADVFYDRSYDLLVSNSGVISSMLGATNAYVPNGKIENKGFEAGLNITDLRSDFKYDLGCQFSFVRSKILNMNESYQPYDYMKRTGRPLGQTFGLEAIGFFKDEAEITSSPTQIFSKVYPGDVKYKDQNGDGRIDEYDVVAIGHNNICPEVYYSFSLALEYKDFGVNALLQGIGNYSKLLNTTGLFYPLMNNTTVSQYYLDNCWHPGADNNNAKYPRLTTTESANNYRSNTLFVNDASYLKLRQAELYYKLPTSLTNVLMLSDCKIFVRGMDLFSFNNIKVIDPENYDAAYPLLKTYHLGFSVNF